MLPKVSCIMPTCFGDQFVEAAIKCFLDQNYEGEKELVIVDNNDQPTCSTEWVELGFKYIRSKRKPVGALRNEGIKEATGEIICIFDEDDWHAPNRITQQVNRLIESGCAVTGWHGLLYFDDVRGATYRYNCHQGDVGKYAVGASQCF